LTAAFSAAAAVAAWISVAVRGGKGGNSGGFGSSSFGGTSPAKALLLIAITQEPPCRTSDDVNLDDVVSKINSGDS
jgi:hypothetical protein